MNITLWNTLLKTPLLKNSETNKVQQWIQSGQETSLSIAALAQLQGIFIQLSQYRMETLANLTQLSPLSKDYFGNNDLAFTWKKIHSIYQCSKEELADALYINEVVVNMWDRSINDREKYTFTETFERFIGRTLDVSSTVLLEKQIEEPVVQKEEKEVEENVVELVEIEKVEVVETVSQEKDFTFLEQLSVLQTSSVQSVVHAEEFTELQHYMHVERPIQEHFIRALEEAESKNGAHLIMLCGSVGDGKSHLISYVHEIRPELLEQVYVHNDSTESHNPSEDEIETLEKVLAPFEGRGTGRDKVVLAINLGVLHNFYAKHRHTTQFPKTIHAIEASRVFEVDKDFDNSTEDVTLLNFAGLQPYEISDKGATSRFFEAIIKKIVAPTKENPFYRAWQKDRERDVWTPAHLNYSLLQEETMPSAIVQVLVEAMMKEKLFLSTRALYNVIYDMIVPLDNTTFHPDHMLPSLLFSRPERSELMHALHTIDPVARRAEVLDSLLREFILTNDVTTMIQQHLTGNAHYLTIWENTDGDVESYSKLLIRHYYILNHAALNERFYQFLQTLFSYYTETNDAYEKLFHMMMQAIERWIGSPKERYIYIDAIGESNYQLAIPFQANARPGREFGQARGQTEINRLKPEVELGLDVNGKTIYVTIDYALFELLCNVANGYRPTRQDYTEALQFVEFYSDIIRYTDKSDEMLIVHIPTKQMVRMKKPFFGGGLKKYEVESIE